MAKNKLVKSNGSIIFEKDEKKSIIIALVVSAVVVLATVLAIIAIRHRGNSASTVTEEVIDSYTITDNYSEDGSIIVTTQEELDEKLTASQTDDTIGAITIQTEEEQSIEIPEGDYTKLALSVDAPYTEVSNYANFNTINIKQISANTWVEHASGNSIQLQAAASHVIVESDASVETISNMAYGSTLAIEIYGTVNTLSLEADDSISSVSVNGSLGSLEMYSKTNLSLSGSGAEKLNVNLQSGATGSVVKSSVPVNMEMYGSADLYMEEGAEESSISVLNGDLVTNLHNNTTMPMDVNSPEGGVVTVANGEESSFGEEKAPEATQETSAVSSGSATGSSSSGSSSSSSSRSSGSSGGSSNAGVSSGSSSSTASQPATSTTQQATQQTQQTQQQTQQSQQQNQSNTNKNTQNTISNSATIESYKNKVSEQDKKITDQNKTITSLNDSLEELKKTLKGLVEKNEEYEEELEQTHDELDEAYRRILDAQKTAIIDSALIDPEYVVNASVDGYVIHRTANEDIDIVQRVKSANDNSAEYIWIKNREDTQNAYSVKIFYYYFIDSDNESNGQTRLSVMETENSMVLRPGDSWIFTRQKKENLENCKYTIEIVTSYLGEQDPRIFIINMEDVGLLKCDYIISDSSITDIQAVFFNSEEKIVGITTYKNKMPASEATTDINGINGDAITLSDNQIQFYTPADATKWEVFVN